MRVTAGMRDLRNFYVRANSCVACHQNLDNELLAAGHPQLRFELDGQSVVEPKHWQDPVGSGAKAWLVGQAVALREISWNLSNIENPTGEAIAKWNALVWLLAKVAGRDARLTGLDAPGPPFTHAVFINTQQRADSLARKGSEVSLGDDFGRLALLGLTNADSDFVNGSESRETLFCRAERLAPAVYRLAVSTGRDSDVSPRTEGRALFEAIQTYGAFDPVRFGKALATYREAIGNSASGKAQ
jgi:hypothetical protein